MANHIYQLGRSKEASMRCLHWVVACSLFLTSGEVLLSDEPTQGSQQKWGDVRGRFVFDGAPPKPVEVRVTKDEKIHKGPIFVESLLVDAKTHGLANVFVWLIPHEDEDLPVHPNYNKIKAEPVVIRMEGLRFQPHCVLLRTGQKVRFLPKDPVGHNPRVVLSKDLGQGSLIPAGGPIEMVVREPEPVPIPIGCHIHPWMSAHVLVQDHPYMALSQATGEFVIKNVAAGKQSFRVWHEAGKDLTRVKINGKEQIWRGGEVKLEVQPGKNDLGDMLISADQLRR